MDREERLRRVVRTRVDLFWRRVRMIPYSCCELNIIDQPLSLSDGHYGLYLDETLYEGSSARCPTFNNDPLSGPGPDGGGGSTATFECVGLEVWGVAPS